MDNSEVEGERGASKSVSSIRSAHYVRNILRDAPGHSRHSRHSGGNQNVNPKSLVSLVGSESGTAPIAPIIRPAHFDYTHPLLLPNEDEDTLRDGIPRHELEKSSSSFLRHLKSPPSTPSEDEAGQMGFQACLCFGQKRHWVDPKFKTPGEADRFGSTLLLFLIFSYVPALLGSGFYVTNTRFRHFLLHNPNTCFGGFFTTVVVYMVFNYFSGVTRHYPYHLVMTFAKSACFGVGYTLANPCLENIWIGIRIDQDPRLSQTDDPNFRKELYEEYIINEEKTYPINPSFDDIFPHNPTHMFLVAISYTVILQVLTFFAVVFSKMSFFGPAYPMITYTTTFVIVLIGTTMTVHEAFGLFKIQNIVWEIGQIICGPCLGLFFTDRYVIFLERLYNGKICPLKFNEFFYAIAHF